jgi:hypothetical protein
MPALPIITKDVIDVVIEALLVLIALAAAWLYYRYVRSVTTQNRLAATTRLADAAIDYVEDLDRRGDLAPPAGAEKGAYKRQEAAKWLQSEMRTDGVKIGDLQAQQWIAAAFQKRSGDSQPVSRMGDLARQAVDLTQRLERAHLIDLPPNADRPLYLAGLAADWITVGVAKEGMTISHEQAMSWVRGEILHRLELQASNPTAEEQLRTLAENAVQFTANLRSSGRMAIRPGQAGGDIDSDVATAWLVTEAAKQGLAVTADQISEAITIALGHHSGPANLVLTAAKSD